MGRLCSDIGPAIALLLTVNAGQAMAFTTFELLSPTDDRSSLHTLVQGQLLDTPSTSSRPELTQNQRSLLENLLDLPGLTERETRLFRQTLERNIRLSAAAEGELRRYLRRRIAELEREEEQSRLAEIERRRQEEEKRRAAELERQRQEEEQQRAAELERQRLEEERLRAAEAERRRQEEERQRAAELERQRQEEEERQRAAEAERLRQEEEQQRAAEAERLREEQERQRAAELERQRQEEERQRLAALERERQQRAATPSAPDLEVLTEQQRILLGNLMGLSFMSSVERGMMQKVLDDNRRLSDVEEARLQQRYAALKEFDEPPAPPAAPVETGPSTPPPTTSADPPIETGKVDVIDLLPRFKVEMPSPI